MNCPNKKNNDYKEGEQGENQLSARYQLESKYKRRVKTKSKFETQARPCRALLYTYPRVFGETEKSTNEACLSSST